MPTNQTDPLASYITENQNQFYRIAVAITGNREDALDAIQDAIFNALRKKDGLKETAYLKTWFHRILINASIDVIRKNKKYRLTDEDYLLDSPVWNTYSDLDHLDLASILAQLTPEQRAIITLRFFEDMKLTEIATALDLNLNTVKTRLYAALSKLKITMTEEEVYEHVQPQ